MKIEPSPVMALGIAAPTSRVGVDELDAHPRGFEGNRVDRDLGGTFEMDVGNGEQEL